MPSLELDIQNIAQSPFPFARATQSTPVVKMTRGNQRDRDREKALKAKAKQVSFRPPQPSSRSQSKMSIYKSSLDIEHSC